MVKIIIIPNVPAPYVQDFPTKMEFILLHKLLDNRHYQNYYIKNKGNGMYKIADNSAFELGESLDGDLLLEWAKKVNASEIIIPDVYGDKEKTIELMEAFLKKEDSKKYRLMAVPQGKDEKERRECLEYMMNHSKIKCIGLNKNWDRGMYNVNFSQSELESAAKDVYEKGKDIHMLGTVNLFDWNHPATKYMRSADSRILTKIVTGVDDIWESYLDNKQQETLQRLIEEVDGSQRWK